MYKSQKAVSIIIPFYNGETFLDRCLECATSQFENLDYEIILVNDGSTDNSIKIIEPWLEKNDKLALITTENKGVSSARNTGIEHATGDYLWFMDVDDIIKFGSLEKIYKYASEQDLDIASFGVEKLSAEDVSLFLENPRHFTMSEIDSNRNIISGLDYLNLTKGLIWEYACVWQYIFKREIIQKNKIRFNCSLIYSEDLLFMWSILPKVKSVGIIVDKAYYYVQNPNSCLHSKNRTTRKKKAESLRLLAEILAEKGNLIISSDNQETYNLLECLKEDLIYRYLISLQSIGVRIPYISHTITDLKEKGLYPIGKYASQSPYMPHGLKWKLYLRIINSPLVYILCMVITNSLRHIKLI
ncbi:glycosyltransferase [Bacteroides caecimuris]|uniref:glycosyltransferase n=1 Tax=Bacteroides caecimuris TaxID=1796613 RepID=UPI0025745F2F|nr:glycosyltransferase [Bacteroides caecimuris]